jgi:hypothetical protein
VKYAPATLGATLIRCAWLMKTTLRSARGVIAVRLDAAPAGLPLARCDSLFFIGAIVEGSYRASNPASPRTIFGVSALVI